MKPVTLAVLVAAACTPVIAQPAAVGSADALTAVERAQGWTLLTGAEGMKHWRGYRKDSFPASGWTLSEGVLTHAVGGGGGDIITREQFGDFDLVLQYRVAPRANSGIIYRVVERGDYTWQTGPEFQVLDDHGHNLAGNHPHSAGALYDLFTPAEGKLSKPAGEWNDARVVIRNGVIQHWLNGVKVVEVRAFNDDGSPTAEWADAIKRSKFAPMQGFGVQPRGHVALQDHGDEVSFRNVRVRDLGARMPGEVALFNGRNLDGWTVVGTEADSGTWTVREGVLLCTGDPAGYIRTNEAYTNFILRVEWRWDPETGRTGNSGVLVRVVGEDKVWPRSVEAQLHAGNAGDFICIGGTEVVGDPARTSGRRIVKSHAAERPAGEWNEYEIIVNGGEITLIVNGETLNHATGAEVVAGTIALQSEGTPIQFRNVRLVRLD